MLALVSARERYTRVFVNKVSAHLPWLRGPCKDKKDSRPLTSTPWCSRGFLAFADPPNSDVARALARLKRDGVEVKILTGDNEPVTRRTCCQVGFPEPVIVLGPELDTMTDPALNHVAEEANVFAHVTPMQKLRILQALRHRGHVVGFIGDGINDAPALHAADLGISVATAVDVARDAADNILGIFDFVGVVYFVWRHDWVSALGVALVSAVLGRVVTAGTSEGSLAQTAPGRIMLLQPHPMNLIVQVARLGVLLYALRVHALMPSVVCR
jgi:cation transport ATPase